MPDPGSRAPPVPLENASQHDEPALEGIVHVVRRGETVYRIARAYGIDPADLMETNGVSDPRAIAVGAELFVPGATRLVEVPPAPVPGDPAPAGARVIAPADPGPSSHTPAPVPDAGPTPHTPSPAAITASRGGDAPLAWPLKGVLYGRYGVRGGRLHLECQLGCLDCPFDVRIDFFLCQLRSIERLQKI
jgi:LysM repeat protein